MFILSLVLAFAVTGISQEGIIKDVEKPQMEGGPIMTLESLVVDYGYIEQHADPLRIVKFTNTGIEPLVIKSARGSCGCTVPTWPKEPIMPGETGQIEIRYDTKRVGKFNKKVTITTNELADPHIIKVHGETFKPAVEDSVPPAQESILKPKKN